MSGQVSEAPFHDGDGYSWGGDIIVTIDGLAINLGTRANYGDRQKLLALAHKLAAVLDLFGAQTIGGQVNTPDFLDWLADRLVSVYGESESVDFVQSLRKRATAGRAAIAKAEGRS